MVLFTCRELSRPPLFEGWTLQVDAGELVVLTGPSGSGKTTALRALADLDPVTRGTVLLNGVERNEIAPHVWRRRVLYVHPAPPRFPGTVADNLALVASLGDGSPGDETPREPDALPPLDPAADAERLSSGEAQLLALWRALLADPSVLLLDEGTASLDPERARAVEAALRAWTARGARAVVWVSHDAGLADRLGGRRVRFP